jgi:rod shape determining protein RodA
MTERYGMQLIWIGGSLLIGVMMMLLDYKYYHIFAYPVYILAMIVVLLTLTPLGHEANGARAWLKLGPILIQPAEFLKIGTALAVARLMSAYTFSTKKLNDVAKLAMIIGVPMLIILLQNDTGSALVYCSFLFMLFREGLNVWIYIVIGFVVALFVLSFWIEPTVMLVLLILVCTMLQTLQNGNIKESLQYLAVVTLTSIAVFYLFVALGASVAMFWCIIIALALSLPLLALYAYRYHLGNVFMYLLLFVFSVGFSQVTDVVFDKMQPHQQHRILDLLGIESDVSNWGYNVIQSKIAIGSGGFAGKGFMNGTQTKLKYVPEQDTDFIFCTVGEEQGFLGSSIVLLLFLALILRLIYLAELQDYTYGRVYGYCVMSILLFHVFINVGMVIGLTPVIGIPLPFFSYGGSSLWGFTILLFIFLRIDAARKQRTLRQY